MHFVETTRGCPIDCEFCAVSTAFGGKYRNRPLEEVMRELRGLKPFDGLFTLKNCVFFVDDNIISNRAYARELLTRLAELKFSWFGQASMNIARDPEILRLCQQSGCVGLFIGFESLSPETLAAVGKRVNRPTNTWRSSNEFTITASASTARSCLGSTPTTTVFSTARVEFVIKAKLEVAYFSILTPYPGTRLYQRLVQEDRLLTKDWSLYDANHVVFRPKPFTPGSTAGELPPRTEGDLQRPRHFQTAVGNHRLEELLLPDELRFPPGRNEGGERRQPAGGVKTERHALPQDQFEPARHTGWSSPGRASSLRSVLVIGRTRKDSARAAPVSGPFPDSTSAASG